MRLSEELRDRTKRYRLRNHRGCSESAARDERTDFDICYYGQQDETERNITPHGSAFQNLSFLAFRMSASYQLFVITVKRQMSGNVSEN
jgi:hypothetical protein